MTPDLAGRPARTGTVRAATWLAWGVVYLGLLWAWKGGFLVWGQINDFYHATPLQFAPIPNFVPGEPSGVGIPAQLPRAMLMLPVLVIGKVLGVSPHVVFTIVGVGLVAWSAWLLGRASGRRDEGFWIALGALSLAMNGRMLWALAGASLLLWAAAGRREPKRLFLACFTAAFFCTVSTGAFSIAVAAIGWLLVQRWRTHREARQPLIGVLVFAAPWFLSAIEKNVSYFARSEDGVVAGLLGHGMGRLLLLAGHMPWMLPLALGLIALGWWLWPRLRGWLGTLGLPPFTLELLALGLAGGLFGYSTAVLAAPAALVVAAAAATRLRQKLTSPTA